MGKVILVTSAGGHLTNLLALRDAWEGWEETWVCRDALDARTRLEVDKVEWLEKDADRNHLWNYLGGFVRAWKGVKREKPDRLITMGAGPCLPWVIAARIQGVPCLYIELFGRVEKPTVSAKISRWFGAKAFVQHRTLLPQLKGSTYEGTLW
ncbi:UDP-N-acetylglucosamine--LPS N-acetylglucosamine transferase [bacterium]|nr:UDP-N-acetylglucosamine--LPS N-acetylglucosamine transferase [bacterium]